MKTRVMASLAVLLFHVGDAAIIAPLHGGEQRKDRYGDPLPAGALVRMGTVRMRHGEAQLTISPDGKTLISAGNDRTVRFWNLDTGEAVRVTAIPLPGPEQPGFMPMEMRQLTPDGRTLAVTSHDVLTLWDTTTGKKLAEIAPGKGVHRKLAVSGDGRTVALLYDDGRSVGVWDTATKKEAVVVAVPGRVEEMALAPDGKCLVTAAGGEHSLRLWELPSGKELRSLEFPGRAPQQSRSLAFSPQGDRLALGSWGDNVLTWDVATGELLSHYRPKSYQSGGRLAFSPDGKTLADGGELNVRILDVATGKVIGEVIGEGGGCVVFSPNGKTVAACGAATATELGVWDVATGKPQFTPEGHSGEVWYLAVSPDGKTLVSRDSGNLGSMRLWEASTGKPLGVLGDRTDARFFLELFAVRAKGWPSAVVATGGTNGVVLWDLENGREFRRFTPEPPKAGARRPSFRTAHLTADGTQLLALAETGRPRLSAMEVYAWETDPVKLAVRGGAPTSYFASISRDGREVLGERDFQLVLHDLTTGKDRVTLPPGLALPGAFAPDGRYVAVLGQTEPVRAVNMFRPGRVKSVCLAERETGKVFLRLETGYVGRPAVSSDGRFVATAGADSLRVWEVASGKSVGTIGRDGTYLTAPAYPFVRCLAFLPDGRRLATGMTDSTVLVWDLLAAAGPKDGDDLDPLWNDLAGTDAVAAYRAGWLLAAKPTRAIPHLRERLKPVPSVDEKRLQRLVADLDSEDFETRQTAVAKLTDAGELAEPVLRKVLDGRPPLEVRRRVEALLEQCWSSVWGPLPAGEKLRTVRAVAVLERIGSADARQMLEKLAGGDPSARETREAKAALHRLADQTVGAASRAAPE